MAWATKQQNPPLLILFDSCFLQFWLEQHKVMTYACNTAYLPSFSARWETNRHGGHPSNKGQVGLLGNQFTPKGRLFSLTWFSGRDSVSIQRKKPYGHNTPQPGALLALGHTKMTLRAPGQSQSTPGPTPSDGWWVEGTRGTSQASWFLKQNASTVGFTLSSCKQQLKRRGLHFQHTWVKESLTLQHSLSWATEFPIKSGTRKLVQGQRERDSHFLSQARSCWGCKLTRAGPFSGQGPAEHRGLRQVPPTVVKYQQPGQFLEAGQTRSCESPVTGCGHHFMAGYRRAEPLQGCSVRFPK